MAWPSQASAPPSKAEVSGPQEGQARMPGRHTLGCSPLGTTEGNTLQVGFQSVDSWSTGHRVFLFLDLQSIHGHPSSSGCQPRRPLPPLPPEECACAKPVGRGPRRRGSAWRPRTWVSGARRSLAALGCSPCCCRPAALTRDVACCSECLRASGPPTAILELSRCAGKLPGRGLRLPG